jgi:simple sugar transport system permease protein
MVKAGPLILIAQGLAIGFRARIYNIGAEGQLIMGALAGGGVAIAFDGVDAWWVLPLMVIAGAIGGALWGPSRPCCAPASTPRRPSPP